MANCFDIRKPRVTVNTKEYKAAHGREPRGRGLWLFAIDSNEVDLFGHNGTFSEALRAARAKATKSVKAGNRSYGMASSTATG